MVDIRATVKSSLPMKISQSRYFLEIKPENLLFIQHDIRGILGMANQGPHTNNSQFYMTLNSTPFMDKKYVAFGRVIRGSQTLNTIERAEAVNERPTEPITVTASGLL